MIVIVGAPGGGTSFFTKFLRYNGFYAGKSLEEGRENKDHIGYLYRRKWHESIVYANHFCKAIFKQLGVGPDRYELLFTERYSEVIDHINKKTEDSLQYFIKDNKAALDKMLNDEFPDRTIPYGFKNPRSFLLLPFIKAAYPTCRILTVERNMNPNPSNQGPEGKGFASNVDNKDFRKRVYGHKDDFRFQFEDFTNVERVNELLNFVGLDLITNDQLKEQLKTLEFDAGKIGK